MKRMKLKENKVIVGDSSFTIDDLYTHDFMRYSEEMSSYYNNSSFFVNELFLYYIQPYLAFKLFVETNNIEGFELDKPNEQLRIFYYDLMAERGKVPIPFLATLIRRKQLISGHTKLLLTLPYMMFKLFSIPKSKIESEVFKNDIFAITRQKSATQKITKGGFKLEIETLSKENSIYRFFSFRLRLKWTLKSYFRSLKSWREIKSLLTQYIGPNTACYSFSFYSIRLLHSHVYEQLITEVFQKNTNKTFITGSNLDRYAIIEEKFARKFNLKTINIPHGLEYGFKFPYGFTSDIFYTYSVNAANHLNKLYSTDKFRFYEKLINDIFKVKYKNKDEEIKKIVYFTEPRETEVNIEIINSLIPFVKNIGVDLFLKLHPNDKLERYKHFDLKILANYDESITGNIVIARKSTVLLEAIYNNSVSAAVIINSKDRSIYNTFPSLMDDRIHVSYSLNELHEWIKKILKIDND